MGRLQAASDERLMERYVRGEEAAFEELFRRYEGRVYGFFLRRTGCEEQARDLYQELFLRVHRAREAYDASRPFAPWLFQIARRLLLDDYRRAFRHHEVSLGGSELSGGGQRPDERLERASRAAAVLAALSAEERRVLLCAKVEGRGYAEIAEELGKSRDAVKKLASRAMQRLRGAFGEEFGLPDRG